MEKMDEKLKVREKGRKSPGKYRQWESGGKA